MSRRMRSAALLASLLSWSATPVFALIDADDPDDICAPTADPCVVADTVRVSPPGVLDFGLRTVRVTGSGRFEQTAVISCGAFVVDVGAGKTAADSNNGGSDAGTFSVTARRACSGDGATPCLDDAVCLAASLGTCSVGSGTITVAGDLIAVGGPGGTIRLRAAGEVSASGEIVVDARVPGTEGGIVEIESATGSVTLFSEIKGNSGAPGEYGEPEDAGHVSIDAAIDVRLAGAIELSGGQYAGALVVAAGRDVLIENDITSTGGALFYASGGTADLTAGRDIRMLNPEGSGATRLRLNAGSRLNKLYGAPYPGDGGNAFFTAGGDIDIDALSIIESNTPLGSCDANPYGGYVYLIANDQTRVYGDIFSAGKGACGVGGKVRLEAGNRVVVGDQSNIDAVARFGGKVTLVSNGIMDIGGTVNVRGNPPGYLYYLYGQSGYTEVGGKADVALTGTILAGSGDGWDFPVITFDVCRLTLADGARIDAGFGGTEGGASNYFVIGESMTAAPGTEITTNPVVGAKNQIRYRDAGKPPQLLGDVSPAPLLIADPSIPGCPVCGNFEIDQGESCDDGNTTTGDGCRDDCQDEGCVAATPGYPTVSLCDDNDACTVDDCDPVGHACLHVASCEEGIACTLDACVSGACQHTPNDAACDDGNDCTADTCSAVSGCGFVNTTGGDCEDGDICTQTGTCNVGRCVAGDAAHTQKNRLAIRLGSGAADDRLRFKAQMPLAEFGSDPTVTGLVLRIQDAVDGEVLQASVPAARFEALGNGLGFRFRDSDGSVASALGIQSVGVRISSADQVAKIAIKGRDMALSRADGQVALTVSLLWGSDAAADDCVTARRVPCTSRTGSLSCKD